jgi:outer membrane immunogenic protein
MMVSPGGKFWGLGTAMRRLAFIGISALVALAAPPALAADLPLPAKAPPTPVWNWTGCYAGANGGYAFGTQLPSLGPSSDPASQAFWGPAFAAGAAPSSFVYESSGADAGGQIGCKYEFNLLVVGLESDFDWAHAAGNQSVSTSGIPGFASGTFSSSQSLNWLGTTRGLIGIAPVDHRGLFYVTGGAAYGNVSNNLSFSFPGSNDFQSISASNTSFGWTLGAGIEWQIIGNWSAKIEWLHVALGTHAFRSTGSGRAQDATDNVTEVFNDTYETFRGGINYKFGLLSAPGVMQ